MRIFVDLIFQTGIINSRVANGDVFKGSKAFEFLDNQILCK